MSIARRLMIGTALLAVAALASAQPSMHRIGWLGHGNPPARQPAAMSDFLQAMRDAGYVEGRNLAIEYRYANGIIERLPELASDLVRLKVDVIVTSGEPAAFAAKRATNAIPIVVTEFALDPVKAGLVASLARPEGNVTGLISISEELWRKRLEQMKAAVPRLKRVTALSNPDNPANVFCVNELRAAAKGIDAQIRPLEAGSDKALERAFVDMAREPPDAIVVCGDSMTFDNAALIGKFALSRQLPAFAPLREYVVAGSLVSFGASLAAQRRRAASYVDRILKGSKPAALPVERPTHFELVVNTKTAAALRIALPQEWLLLADDLIE
ncbi:MAG TPA: ABC transporter substrate-binding protein [Casimicrobiaceae bacterium]|nr:ABC transporter substrate-binding protein [Casimicrobiaceae bacterium]